jgi:purine-cytosine permease-like protein
MKLNNKSKTFIALLLSAFAGTLVHPINNWLTILLALIPCVVACCIIDPLIKKDNQK